jgi:hypothetical protein
VKGFASGTLFATNSLTPEQAVEAMKELGLIKPPDVDSCASYFSLKMARLVG